jgi:uncharacterized protein (TIGR04222 family)
VALNGPLFLVFYGALAIGLALALWFVLRFAGDAPDTRLSELTADPYRIGCLRKGEREAIRLAVFNLTDRGLLKTSGQYVAATRTDAAEMALRPLERAVLAACPVAVTVKDLQGDRRIHAEARVYRGAMTRRGLMHRQGYVAGLVTGACALLLVVGAARIVASLAQGRANVAFLALEIIAACLAVAAVGFSTPTRAAAGILDSLRALTRRLKERTARIKAGGATSDALLLASVFGIEALPTEKFGFVGQLFQAQATDWRFEADFEFCGSSCGSSCGGGGGCGGCGGCGS